MTLCSFALGLIVFGLAGCICSHNIADLRTAEEKIGFDLSLLDADGLAGPRDGLRAVQYEFCIPAQEHLADEVRQIDTTLQVHPNAGGRIGCSSNEFLCLGSTHQPNFRSVLIRLAQLDYVRRIEESFFEH